MSVFLNNNNKEATMIRVNQVIDRLMCIVSMEWKERMLNVTLSMDSLSERVLWKYA